MPRSKPKHRVRVTLTNGKPDWREYMLWQFGLLFTALSLLYVIMLYQAVDAGPDPVIYQAILGSLLADIFASVVLWRLIAVGYSRSKRFALGAMLLADLFAKLLLLRHAAPDDAIFGSPLYLLLIVGTGGYLLGTAVIGLIIYIRGDKVVSWWKLSKR